MYINYSTFLKLYNEALEQKDLELFIAERGWQDWMGEDVDLSDEVVTLLKVIHEAPHADFKWLRGLLNLTQAEMIRKYNINRRTLQYWESDNGKRPSDHVKKLLLYAVIMEALNSEVNSDDVTE